MTLEKKYERIGKCIYSACRYGRDLQDVHHWMADELGIARPHINDDEVPNELYTAYFTKYASDEEFEASYQRFIEAISKAPAPAPAANDRPA